MKQPQSSDTGLIESLQEKHHKRHGQLVTILTIHQFCKSRSFLEVIQQTLDRLFVLGHLLGCSLVLRHLTQCLQVPDQRVRV